MIPRKLRSSSNFADSSGRSNLNRASGSFVWGRALKRLQPTKGRQDLEGSSSEVCSGSTISQSGSLVKWGSLGLSKKVTGVRSPRHCEQHSYGGKGTLPCRNLA